MVGTSDFRDTETGPLPLVIGVTGHRDLVAADSARIRELLDTFFTRLRRQYPHTPLRLLSPLAEGADRLVAQVALQHGAELVVPLPMPEAEYRKDFPGSLAEFEALKARAAIVYVLPQPPADTGSNAGLSGPRRDECYEKMGLHVVKHAQLILALWDGVVSADRGGTAHVVGYALAGPTRGWSSHPARDAGSGKTVWHLQVPRSGNRTEEGGAAPARQYTAVWRFSDEPQRLLAYGADGAHWPDHELRDLQAMEAFNADALSLSAARVQASLQALLPAGVDLKAIDPSERIVRTFVAADLISEKFQKAANKLWKWIFVLAGVMILGFEGYAHLWEHSPLLLVYPAAFIAMTVAYAVLNRRRLNDRFIDARILAEALRVLIYWRLAGVRESIADQYLGRHIAVIGWIRGAIPGLLTLPATDAGFAQGSGLRIADEFWVDRQRKYYARQSARQGRRLKFYHRFAGSLYALTLMLSICVAIYGVIVTRPSPLRNLLIFLMACGPPVAVLWIAYAEKQGWEKHVRDYTRNAALFEQAHGLIEKFRESGSAEAFPQVQKVLHDLGKEAIYENAEWAVLHRVKPPTIPIG